MRKPKGFLVLSGGYKMGVLARNVLSLCLQMCKIYCITKIFIWTIAACKLRIYLFFDLKYDYTCIRSSLLLNSAPSANRKYNGTGSQRFRKLHEKTNLLEFKNQVFHKNNLTQVSSINLI